MKRPTHNGGSGNPIVYHDYESFIAKFADNPKTTDDCYTPPDIYDAVVKWLGTKIDLTGKQILRPFYPGGDYVMAEYPEDGIVIDNPPFSMFLKIVKFYCTRNVPFFLFGPGLTIGTCFRWCTAIFISDQIRFSNGAMVRCNFASNLFGDAAEETVLNYCNRSLESLYEEYGRIPAAITQGTLMLVANSYKNREPASVSNLYLVPYTFDALVKPYMIL